MVRIPSAIVICKRFVQSMCVEWRMLIQEVLLAQWCPWRCLECWPAAVEAGKVCSTCPVSWDYSGLHSGGGLEQTVHSHIQLSTPESVNISWTLCRAPTRLRFIQGFHFMLYFFEKKVLEPTLIKFNKTYSQQNRIKLDA